MGLTATTKIWPINDGGKGKTAAAGKVSLVIDYVENEDKTVEVVYRLVTDKGGLYTEAERSTLDDVIDYAEDKLKTEEKKYVTGINLNVETAREEICATKKYWHKEDKILLWHGYQSFAAGEVTPEEAHRIGVELAESLWGENYEILVTTHLNTGHLHNHFVINSVSFNTGKKLDAKWQNMRRESDRICEKYGKSVVNTPQYKAAAYKSGTRTWITPVKEDIDEAVRMSTDITDFLKNMAGRGYTVKYGTKYFTVRPPGKERFIRADRRLGDDYSMSGIAKRISDNVLNGNVLQNGDVKRCTIKRCVKRISPPKRRLSRFERLYYYYCYKLGTLPKRNISPCRISYPLREDLRRAGVISEEAVFIHKNGIESVAGLKLLMNKKEAELKEIYKSRRRVNEALKKDADNITLSEKYASLNRQAKNLRKEINMCKDIRDNTDRMKYNMSVERQLTRGRIIRQEEKGAVKNER